jgi:flagellar hook-associated protein 2
MAVFSFSGLATGIDTGSLVDELVKIRRRPLDLEIARRDGRQATRDAFATLESKLRAVKTALTDLRTPQDVLVKTASSSDTGVLTASAGTGAADGLTTVTVSQLATASRATAGAGLSAVTDTVASATGTFEFTVGGGDTQTVNVTSSTTLQELVDAVNALNAGVTASAVNVGTPSAASYKLQIVANSTGTTSDIAIVNDDTDLAISATAAQNAQFTITGFPETIERSSNTVSDAIPGVTFVLKQGGGASAEIAVSNDASAIETKVQAFVDAFNDVVSFINDNTAITRLDDETSTTGSLAANPTVRGVLDRLREDIRTSITDTSGGVSTLSQIGIATQLDGTIAFDTATFQSEFAAKPQGVAELLGGVGLNDGVGDLLDDTIDGLTQVGGLLNNVQDNLDAEIRRVDDAIEAGERAIEAFRRDLEATFAVLETTVNTIQSQGEFLLNQLVSVRNFAPGNGQS